MPGRAPAGGPAPWSFDRAACHADLDALEELLTSKAELSERRDVLRFFTEHPHLSAFLGSYHPNATAYDRLGVEVELFGQFTADVIAGDKTSQAYALLEFEDGRANSMFVRRGRQTSEWAQRFEHAFGQIIDWLWLLDDQQLAARRDTGPFGLSRAIRTGQCAGAFSPLPLLPSYLGSLLLAPPPPPGEPGEMPPPRPPPNTHRGGHGAWIWETACGSHSPPRAALAHSPPGVTRSCRHGGARYCSPAYQRGARYCSPAYQRGARYC